MADVGISSGRHFSANDGESILDAALRQHIVLEYGCRTGRCGTCRARLRTGSTVALHDELGLSPAERASGWILTCVRKATSNVALDVDDLTGVTVHPARTVPCRIHALQPLSVDVMRATLRLPPGTVFSYHPGQYIDVIGHGGVRRSYSIANAPAAAGLLELHIRKIGSGAMSDYWFGKAAVNDLLRLRGPLGTCFLRDVAGQDLIFLATGTGIAPIKAMLEGLSASDPAERPRSIVLYWGGRVPQDLYWNARSIGMDCGFVPVLSRAEKDWDGLRGHVQDAALDAQPDMRRTLVYACGSDAMIRSARRRFIAAGLPERNYRSDAFVSSGEAA
ncbi:MAG TPA: 2Fe-2S iron-sulfur cluster-binding protein [Steroidobacteraceae bacterium]|nr:2Fe-2S iron-sulfur cluster-binding protein [Steroidobacteraceae bacterium]